MVEKEQRLEGEGEGRNVGGLGEINDTRVFGKGTGVCVLPLPQGLSGSGGFGV